MDRPSYKVHALPVALNNWINALDNWKQFRKFSWIFQNLHKVVHYWMAMNALFFCIQFYMSKTPYEGLTILNL